MMKSGKLGASVTVYLSLVLSAFVFMIFTFVKIGIIGNEKLRFEIAANLSLNSVLGEYSKALYDYFDLLYIDASYLNKAPSIENVTDRIKYYMTENAQKSLEQAGSFWGRIKVDNVSIDGFECATSGDYLNMVGQAVTYVKDSPHLTSLLREVRDAINESDGMAALDSVDSFTSFSGYKEAVDGIPLPKKKNERNRWVEVPVSNPADWVYGLSTSDIGYLVELGNITVSSSQIDTSNLLSNRGAVNTAGIKNNYGFEGESFGTYEADKFGCFLNEKDSGGLMLGLEYVACGRNSDYDNFSEICQRLFKWRLADNLTLAFNDAGLNSEAYEIAAQLEVSTLNPAFINPVKDSIVAACAYLETISDIHCLLTGGKVPVNKSFHNMSVTNVLMGNKYFVPGNEGLSYRQYLEGMIFMENVTDRVKRDMDLMELEVRSKTGNAAFSMDYCIEEIDVTLNGIGSGIKEYEIKRRYGFF